MCYEIFSILSWKALPYHQWDFKMHFPIFYLCHLELRHYLKYVFYSGLLVLWRVAEITHFVTFGGVKRNICEFLSAYDLVFKAAHQHSDHAVHELFMHHKSSKKKHSACCQYMPDLIQDEREDNCITVLFIIKTGQGKFIQTTFLWFKIPKAAFCKQSNLVLASANVLLAYPSFIRHWTHIIIILLWKESLLNPE